MAAIESRAFDARRPVDLTLVLACYNEGPALAENVATIVDVLDQCRWSYELLFIDDCSVDDDTSASIHELVEAYPEHQIRADFHAQNQGRGATVVEGMRAGRGAIVGFIDIDLEVHARYVPSCVRAVELGADVATAQRNYKFRWHSIDRYILSSGYILLVRALLKVRIDDTETGFKFFRKHRILPVFDQTEDRRWFWDTEVMVRAALGGLRIHEIPVLFLRRPDKKSTVRPLSDTLNYFRRLWRFRTAVADLRRGELGASAVRDRTW